MEKKSSSIKRFLILSTLGVIIAVFFIYHYNKHKETQEKMTATVKPKTFVIKIKESLIYDDEFEKMFLEENPHVKDLEGDEYYLNVLKKEFAYNLADEMMLFQLANRSKIWVDSEEISDELKNVKDGYTSESFDDMLKSEGLTSQKFEDLIKKRLLLKKVLKEKVYFDIEITEEEIENFYDQFKSSFYVPEEYKIEKITVQDETRAKEAFKKIKTGKTKFSEAAEEYSLMSDTDEDNMEYIPKSGLPEEFEEELERLKPGRISGIINTKKGYHIIKLIDKKKGHVPPINAVKEKIKRILREKKEKAAYGIFIRNLRKEKKVIINDEYFEDKSDES